MSENENSNAATVVVVLTPYRALGKRKRTEYLRRAIAHTFLHRREVPVGVPNEDDHGYKAQRALINVANRVVAYVDHGISAGMTDGIEFARSIGREVMFGSIGK